jgi:hypothetical protein
MFSIAPVLTQVAMRRSLIGARGQDQVVPDRSRRRPSPPERPEPRDNVQELRRAPGSADHRRAA